VKYMKALKTFGRIILRRKISCLMKMSIRGMNFL
jgi:hypothetical protein